jgi:hypothetical protein
VPLVSRGGAGSAPDDDSLAAESEDELPEDELPVDAAEAPATS